MSYGHIWTYRSTGERGCWIVAEILDGTERIVGQHSAYTDAAAQFDRIRTAGGHPWLYRVVSVECACDDIPCTTGTHVMLPR